MLRLLQAASTGSHGTPDGDGVPWSPCGVFISNTKGNPVFYHSLRSRWVLPLVVLLCCGGVATAAQPEGPGREDGFVPLFDGRLLSGWEGNGVWFRVEQGAIVAGRLDRRIPQNQFLCTTRSFGDFELRLQVKLVGPGANAGIQFRSSRIAGSEEVRGYQADAGEAAGRSVWGGLYDESRRRKFLAPPDDAGLDTTIAALVKPEEWNDYRIRCVGPRIELYLNGVQTVDYTESDPEVARAGIIGLQIHSGPPAEAWYRNLRIKPL